MLPLLFNPYRYARSFSAGIETRGIDKGSQKNWTFQRGRVNLIFGSTKFLHWPTNILPYKKGFECVLTNEHKFLWRSGQIILN